jgi:Membrane magnesium transporter
MISQSLLFIGCVLILHAAYSLQHFRSLVQDLVESSTGISIDVVEVSTIGDIAHSEATSSSTPYRIPPLDIYVELGMAFVMLLVSEFIRPGSSMQRAVAVKGEKSIQNQSKPIIGAPFISRDFDIYTTRKSKLQ